MEIKAAGFAIETHRLIEENISGSVAAKQRPGFIKLIDRMEHGDVLVVTKLDRLGRNAMDVRATVEQLENSRRTRALPRTRRGRSNQSGGKDDDAGYRRGGRV